MVSLAKKGKIYKIDISTMKIIDEFAKVSCITKDKHIYRVLNGENQVYKDGYMYRKSIDVLINNDGTITDLLGAMNKIAKKEFKYEYTINLLKNSTYSISEICELSKRNGIKVSEATCRKLKKEYKLMD